MIYERLSSASVPARDGWAGRERGHAASAAAPNRALENLQII